MTDVNELIDGVVAKAADYEERMKEEAKTIFAAVTTAMKEHPLVFLRWEQYTPYFNDGEECTFSVHDIEVFGEIDGEEIGERYEGGLKASVIKNAISYRETGNVAVEGWYVQHYGEEKAKQREIEKFSVFRDLTTDQLKEFVGSVEWAEELAGKLSKLPDDIFRNAFGDHVQVKLNGEGAEADEYSHD